MADIETLKELRKRLAAATEDDRGLFLDVAKAALGRPLSPTSDGEFFHTFMRLLGAQAWESAALALVRHVLPEWDWILSHTNGGLTIHAQLGPRDDYYGETPSLAILNALVANLIIEIKFPVPALTKG